jgi:hypothetical protein
VLPGWRPRGARWGRDRSHRWQQEQGRGFLQLLSHLAGQLFSPSGSNVRQGLPALPQLHKSYRMPKCLVKSVSLFEQLFSRAGRVALEVWNQLTGWLYWLLSLDKNWCKYAWCYWLSSSPGAVHHRQAKARTPPILHRELKNGFANKHLQLIQWERTLTLSCNKLNDISPKWISSFSLIDLSYVKNNQWLLSYFEFHQ